MANSVYDIIDSLGVGSDWKSTFKKIHLKYYKNYTMGKYSYPIFWTPTTEISNLSIMNSFKLWTWFNPLGLIFGPFYYVFKGMYKKAIIFLVLFLIMIYINDVTRAMTFFIFLYCACFINVDYFEKMVLKHPDVVSNPIIIGDDFNEKVLADLLTKKTNPIPYIFLVLILLSPCFTGILKAKSDSESLKYLVSEPTKTCNGRDECVTAAKAYLQKINTAKDNQEISKLYYEMALAYFSIDDYINATKSLDSSLLFNNDNINAYLLRAKICVKMKNNVQALLDYKEALRINPKATFLNYYIGYNYYALGKYERALEHFEEATSVHDDPSYFEAQAYARQMLQDKQGAIKDIKKAIALYNKENKTDKAKKLEEYLKAVGK